MATRRWQRLKTCRVCRRLKYLRNYRYIGSGRERHKERADSWSDVCRDCENEAKALKAQ